MKPVGMFRHGDPTYLSNQVLTGVHELKFIDPLLINVTKFLYLINEYNKK